MAESPTSSGPLPTELARAAGEFEAYLRTERGSSPNTVAAYRRDVGRYLRRLAAGGVRTVGQVRPPHVTDAMMAAAETGAAASTVARALAAVRHFHRFCMREGIADHNPAALADPPARGLALPKPIAEDVVTRLIEGVGGSRPRELRDRAMLELLYAAGLRVSELTALDVDDVDTSERLVRCVGKGDRERVVPIGRAAAAALDRYIRSGRPALVSSRGGPALFLSARGTRLARQSCWAIVRRYGELVSPGTGIFPHKLRHSFATHMLAHGADLRVVQESLGHARLSTTQVYTLVSRQRLKDAFEESHPRAKRRRPPR